MLNKIYRSLFALLLLCMPIQTIFANDWYSEYWQRVVWTMFRLGPITSRVYAEVRTKNHMQGNRFFLISEQLAYNVSDDFRLEVHYSYIHAKPIFPGRSWRWEHRFEFEGNRDFTLPGGARLLTRNRFEIKQDQGNPVRQYRFRQRTQLMFPIEGRGSLKSYIISNEVFYNFLNHYIFQDRVCPMNLTFELDKGLSMDLFFQIQFYTGPTNRGRAAVLGTQFSF